MSKKVKNKMTETEMKIFQMTAGVTMFELNNKISRKETVPQRGKSFN